MAQADPSRLWDFMPGGGFYNPSQLVSRKGLGLFDKIGKDEQTQAALSLRRYAAVNTGWQVKSPEGKDDEDDRGNIVKKWEVTDFVQWTLDSFVGKRAVPYRSLEDMLGGMLTGRQKYGYNVAEKVYEEIDYGPWKGKLGLSKLETRRPHEIDFATDEFGNLEMIQQRQQGTNWVALPPFKFVLSVNRFEWGNFYGTSDLEFAYRPWWAKDNTYKWLLMLLERLGIPPIFLFYDPDSVPTEMKNQIKTILSRLQAGTTAIIPARGGEDSARMQFLDIVKDSADALMAALDKFDNHIAKSLLMPNLLGVSPENKFGSRALGQVQFDVFMLVVEADRTDLMTNVMDGQVIRQLVDLNFGQQDEYPYFEFNPVTDDDANAIFTLWKDLVGSKVVKPQPSDEEHVRRVLEFPPIDEDREEEDDSEPPPIPGGPPFPPGAAPAAPVKPGEDDTMRTPPAARDAFALSRPPGRFERVVAFAEVERKLNGQEELAIDFAREALMTTRDRLLRQVGKRERIDDAFIREITLGSQKPFEAAMRNLLRNVFDAGRDDVGTEVRKAMPQKFQERGPNFIQREAIRFLQTKSIQLAATTYDELLKGVRRVLQVALEAGLPVREAVARLREVFDPFVGNESVLRGGAPLPDYRLEAIVRTESTAAYNQGRLVGARDPDLEGFMQGMLYSAVLDSRTSPVCAHLDGRVFRMDDTDLDRLRPPNHVHCRSVLVPMTIATEIDEGEFITPSQSGRGLELAGKGFV